MMKTIPSITVALSLATASTIALAQHHGQNDPHYAGSTASAPAAKPMPDKSTPAMAHLDAQMKAMQQAHEKMMAAKTPEERSALMAEHMKAMQGGMDMLKSMPPGGMAGMHGDPTKPNQTMEKRMEMMQSMMQMMMDRLPPAVAK